MKAGDLFPSLLEVPAVQNTSAATKDVQGREARGQGEEFDALLAEAVESEGGELAVTANRPTAVRSPEGRPVAQDRSTELPTPARSIHDSISQARAPRAAPSVTPNEAVATERAALFDRALEMAWPAAPSADSEEQTTSTAAGQVEEAHDADAPIAAHHDHPALLQAVLERVASVVARIVAPAGETHAVAVETPAASVEERPEAQHALRALDAPAELCPTTQLIPDSAAEVAAWNAARESARGLTAGAASEGAPPVSSAQLAGAASEGAPLVSSAQAAGAGSAPDAAAVQGAPVPLGPPAQQNASRKAAPDARPTQSAPDARAPRMAQATHADPRVPQGATSAPVQRVRGDVGALGREQRDPTATASHAAPVAASENVTRVLDGPASHEVSDPSAASSVPTVRAAASPTAAAGRAGPSGEPTNVTANAARGARELAPDVAPLRPASATARAAVAASGPVDVPEVVGKPVVGPAVPSARAADGVASASPMPSAAAAEVAPAAPAQAAALNEASRQPATVVAARAGAQDGATNAEAAQPAPTAAAAAPVQNLTLAANLQPSAEPASESERRSFGKPSDEPLARIHGFTRGALVGHALSAYSGRGHEGAEHDSSPRSRRSEERETSNESAPSFVERLTPLADPAALVQVQQPAPDARLPAVSAPQPAAPAAAPVAPPPDVEFVGRAPTAQTQDASISLHHPDLGPIQLEVHREQGRVEVHAVIESTHAEAVLRANERGIRQGVQQSGMTFSALRLRVRGEEPARPVQDRQTRRRRASDRET